MDPPELISCGTIPAAGGVIDDADNCAGFYGPAEFWRTADGVGHGGSLLWTNAYEGGDPSNWARWVIDVEQAGRYKAEIYLTPQYAVFNKVRYEVSHAGAVDVLEVDQGAIEAEGWYALGAFDFAAGQGQHVSVFDNSAVAVPEEQHIAFDALRLTPCDGDDCDDVTPPGPEEGETADGGVLGGCSAAGGGGSPVALLLLAGLFLRRRRRTRI
jgi:MYXO-CTERM domain-containing protein